MKLSISLALSALLAVVSSQTLLEINTSLPVCARNCTLPVLVDIKCIPKNVPELAECMCPNSSVRRRISACVRKQCRFSDVILANRPATAFCAPYPKPSRSHSIRITTIAVLTLSSLFLLLRAVTRIALVKSLWWDDYTIAISGVFLLGFLVLELPLADKGMGKHAWNLPPENIAPLGKMFFSAQLLYALTQVITKISILVLFYRIFPQRWFRNVTLVGLVWMVIHGIVFILLIIFRCWPVKLAWDNHVEGKCKDSTLFTYIGAGFSIFEDLFILALPIPVLLQLNLPMGRKLAIAGMFSIGSLACITSMIRLNYLSYFGSSIDPTWDNVDTQIWSVIEVGVAVICACLPTLRPLLGLFFPRVFGTMGSTKGKASGYGTGGRKSGSGVGILGSSSADRDRKGMRVLEDGSLGDGGDLGMATGKPLGGRVYIKGGSGQAGNTFKDGRDEYGSTVYGDSGYGGFNHSKSSSVEVRNDVTIDVESGSAGSFSFIQQNAAYDDEEETMELRGLRPLPPGRQDRKREESSPEYIGNHAN